MEDNDCLFFNIFVILKPIQEDKSSTQGLSVNKKPKLKPLSSSLSCMDTKCLSSYKYVYQIHLNIVLLLPSSISLCKKLISIWFSVSVGTGLNISTTTRKNNVPYNNFASFTSHSCKIYFRGCWLSRFITSDFMGPIAIILAAGLPIAFMTTFLLLSNLGASVVEVATNALVEECGKKD